jgi:[pyruvate, water dikinase]-phosphate phosphotransferase / [pyruvate, water dikinase] kinase
LCFNINMAATQSLPIYVISGGVGGSGEQVARTVLAQFQDAPVTLKIIPKVFREDHVENIFRQAAEEGALVVHTFVDEGLRLRAQELSDELALDAVDLVGPLIQPLADKLQQIPLGKPGLYRQLYQSYFERVAAMDYTLDHDDGQNPAGWSEAEIILVGASRVGKTPLSLYLSVLGWKVANVPIVTGIPPRDELFALDRGQIVGLTIDPTKLVEHRQHRQRRLGVGADKSDYVNAQKVFEELQTIEDLLHRHGIPMIDVTGKPIETSADEVLRKVKRLSKA